MGCLFFWRRRDRRRKSFGRRILWGVLRTAFAAVLASVLLTSGLRWIDPPTSAFMLRSIYTAHEEDRSDYRFQHDWVDWEQIADSAKVAVVAAEDQRFPEHAGFDLESIADAVHERVTQGRRRGASTISQQVAKNLYLWPGGGLVRKGLEAYFTVLIELFWPKQRVLEIYLNLAQFGDGIYGIEAASRAYFDKSAERLTPREAAMLAAVLPSPTRYRLDPPSDYVQERSEWILAQSAMLGGPSYLRSLSE